MGIAKAATSVEVDPTNEAARTAWDGGSGDFWAEHAEAFDRSLARYGDAFWGAVAVGSDDRVLDVGCGNGETACDAARRAVDGSVLGVDLSARMLQVARRRADEAGLANVTFLQADAQVHPFDTASFDVVVSRTGTMFFGDPVAAFNNLRRALRPGGRLVLLVWQAVPRNAWFVELTTALAAGRALPDPPPDAPGPFSQADPERVREMLTSAGLTDVTFEGLEERMWFGPTPDAAESLVLGILGWLLDGLDDTGRDHARAALQSTIETHSTPDGVLYPSAMWLVTARRPAAGRSGAT